MELPPGYRLRPPVIEDGPAITDMLNEETLALTGVPVASLEWVTTVWTAPGARLDRDFGVITDSGGAVGGRLMIEFEAAQTPGSGGGAGGMGDHNRRVAAGSTEGGGRRGPGGGARGPRVAA